MCGPLVAVLAMATAQPGLALVVEGCEVRVDLGSLDCSLTNDGEVAVAELDFGLLVTEDGRTVPWGRGEGRIPVYGGIEPKETIEFSFPVEGLPEPARGRTLEWEFSRLNARDVDGRRIRPIEASDTADAEPPDEEPVDPGPALQPASETEPEPEETSGVLDIAPLAAAIQACWNIGALSAEAQAIPVTVGFELNGEGRVMNDVRLLSGDMVNDPEVAVAFQAADRAVLRCQGIGYAPPAGTTDGWGWVVLTFDPVAGGVR